MAGRKASDQGKILPRNSETGGWEKNAIKALPHWGASPTEPSLHLWVTVTLPEGPILYPLRETEVQSHKCACWLHLCSKKEDPHFHSGSICTPTTQQWWGTSPCCPPSPHTADRRSSFKSYPPPKGCLTLIGGCFRHPKGTPWAWHDRSVGAKPINGKHVDQGPLVQR